MVPITSVPKGLGLDAERFDRSKSNRPARASPAIVTPPCTAVLLELFGKHVGFVASENRKTEKGDTVKKNRWAIPDRNASLLVQVLVSSYANSVCTTSCGVGLADCRLMFSRWPTYPAY